MKLLHRSDIMPHLKSVINEISSKNTDLGHSMEWHAKASSAVMAETAYAILSHRWFNEGELGFQDLLKVGDISVAGFSGACSELKQPAQDHFASTTILDLAHVHSKKVSAETPRNGTKLLEMMAGFRARLSADKADCGGLVKFVEFCVISGQQGCKYAWMDTCCIDKRRCGA